VAQVKPQWACKVKSQMPACIMGRLHGGDAIDRRADPIRRVAAVAPQRRKQQFAARRVRTITRHRQRSTNPPALTRAAPPALDGLMLKEVLGTMRPTVVFAYEDPLRWTCSAF
jgi:hypothetical protein